MGEIVKRNGENTWIGSDLRRRGDFIECFIIIPTMINWMFWIFKRINRIISIVERNI